jgi:hypothetical protein
MRRGTPLARAFDVSSDAGGSWIAAAVASALVLAAAMLALKGGHQAGVEAAVLWTGRLAFAFFWPSYVGAALATLFGERFQPLRRQGRSLGLGFAAVIAVHLCLVAWLCWIGDAPPLQTFIIFGTAAVWVLALAAASVKRVARDVGPAGWWVLRNVGMNYIALVFAADFVRTQHPFTWVKTIEYLPFAALSILGPLFRLLAWVSRLSHKADPRPLDMGVK